jgi:CubicO group peptidase (beta-lactamase class C family)
MTHHATTLLVAACGMTAPSAAQICDPSPIDAAVEQMLADFPSLLEGACLVVGDRDGILYEGYFGDYGPETSLPLASASKLVSAVGVMTLIDSGAIDPHAPIVDALPDMFAFDRAGPIKPTMTVDEMYSMTSGLSGDAGDPILSDLSLTLEEAVDLIATTVVPAALPATELNYSGLGMHTAGYLCEVLSGKPFDEFYRDAVSIPLNTPSIAWDGLGETQNFRPSGGGACNARDYARLLRMLARGGELDGVRLLSEQAVESMFLERTAGLPYGDVPADAFENGWGYAFGQWVEERDDQGRPTVLTSPGAFGTSPWIDLEDGYWGVFMVEGLGSLVRDRFFEVRAAVESQIIHAGCAPCQIDFNHDGLLDLRDITAFSFLGRTGDRRGDLTGDEIFDLSDIARFVEAFTSGCG